MLREILGEVPGIEGVAINPERHTGGLTARSQRRECGVVGSRLLFDSQELQAYNPVDCVIGHFGLQTSTTTRERGPTLPTLTGSSRSRASILPECGASEGHQVRCPTGEPLPLSSLENP